MKALLIDGSSSRNSSVATVLRYMGHCLETRELKVSTLPLLDAKLSINDPAYYNKPEGHPEKPVRDFVEMVHASDIIVLGTPLYHGSFSGLIKMALDHLDNNAFSGKAIGIVSNAQGARNSMQAAQELVLVARTMKGHVANRLIGTCRPDFEMRGSTLEIAEPRITERTEQLSKELTAAAQGIKGARTNAGLTD